jgi:hypothetical protein
VTWAGCVPDPDVQMTLRFYDSEINQSECVREKNMHIQYYGEQTRCVCSFGIEDGVCLINDCPENWLKTKKDGRCFKQNNVEDTGLKNCLESVFNQKTNEYQCLECVDEAINTSGNEEFKDCAKLTFCGTDFGSETQVRQVVQNYQT